MSAYMQQLKHLAEMHKLTIIDRGAGHIQIRGALLVNWYPESQRRSAYVAGTIKAVHGVSAVEAVRMAMRPPPVARNKAKRKSSYRAIKKRMLERNDLCNWCQTRLTIHTATIDHVIPLHRGGLDNSNNRVLACESCNTGRGHSMPEVAESLLDE